MDTQFNIFKVALLLLGYLHDLLIALKENQQLRKFWGNENLK